MDIDIIRILNYSVGLIGLVAVIWSGVNSVKQKKIEHLEEQKQDRDAKSINNLYRIHDELVETVKDLNEKLTDNYWDKEDVRERIQNNNKLFETKFEHIDKSMIEIKDILKDIQTKQTLR